jgi:3-hydroxyisobutyrate dehydrogenase-like beta-hydroxyacid dehydrogenase
MLSCRPPAGDKELYDACAGPLDVMGKAKFFLGGEGTGANMKLVVNMVMGSMMVAFSEGLSLADKVGACCRQAWAQGWGPRGGCACVRGAYISTKGC